MDFDTSLIVFKENLINKLENCNRVFVAPHSNMDFDAVGAAVAMCELARAYGKEAYIVTNDDELTLEQNLKSMYDKLKINYSFINEEQLVQIRRIKDNSDILVVVDACRTYRVPAVELEIPNFNNVFVVDHHEKGECLIETENAIIRDDVSSACEIMYQLLKACGLKIERQLAHYLMAGIYLDTQQFDLDKFTDDVSMIVTELLKLGASRAELKRLFTITNFENDRKQQRLVSDLIDNTIFEMYNINIAITMNTKETNTLYTSEILAQTADSLLQYAVDAVFVIGFVDRAELGVGHEDVIAIKARSKHHKKEINDEENTIENKHVHSVSVDVNSIMTRLGGGGSKTSAATLIKTSDINAVKEALYLALTPGFLVPNEEEVKKIYQLLPSDIL